MNPNLKPVTTEQPPSGTSLGSLAERLKAKSQQDSIAIQQMTQAELAQLQMHLAALSTAAVSTTQTVIESQQQQIALALTDHSSQIQSSANQIAETLTGSQNQISQAMTEAQQSIKAQGQQISKTLGNHKKTLDTQQSILKAEIQKQTKMLLWLMRLPLLIVVSLCLLIVIATWLWLPTELIKAQTREEKMGNGANYLVITDPNWTNCGLANGKSYPCVPITKPQQPQPQRK